MHATGYTSFMNLFLYVLIGIFGVSSYVVGIKEILKGRYTPSTFSRGVWLLLAGNTFAGLIFSEASESSIFLGGIFLLGNLAIFIVSLRRGSKHIGKLELFCIAILSISVAVWVQYDTPFVNLLLSLFAHFIGALPTYVKVWRNPHDESFGFWSLFFIASILSIFTTADATLASLTFPIYFALFDGSMTLLSLRKAKRI
jgi:hypothetical protein